jgi:hypothetical protein
MISSTGSIVNKHNILSEHSFYPHSSIFLGEVSKFHELGIRQKMQLSRQTILAVCECKNTIFYKTGKIYFIFHHSVAYNNIDSDVCNSDFSERCNKTLAKLFSTGVDNFSRKVIFWQKNVRKKYSKTDRK